MAKESGIAALRKDVNALKKEIGQLTKETPIPPEQAANMAAARQAMPGERPDYLTTTRGNANFETPVREHLARLQGQSRSDLASDAERQAGSPLGGGKQRRR